MEFPSSETSLWSIAKARFHAKLREAWGCVLSFIFVLLVCIPIAVSGGEIQPALSLDEVARCVRERQSRLHMILVDSYVTSVANDLPRTDRIYFASSDCSAFLEYIHNASADIEPWLDPLWFRLCLNNSKLTVFRPFERVTAPADNKSTEMYWKHLYLQAVGWHSKNQQLGDQRTGVFANEFVTATHFDDFELVDSNALEAGVSCVHVATRSGAEEIWFAPEMKYAIVKRVLMRKESGHAQNTFIMSDFMEVAKDIWLPSVVKFESRWHTHDAPSEQILHMDVKVTRLAVNSQIPLDVFETKIPPGTLSVTREEEPTLITRGGQELMDVWGAWCATVLPVTKPRRYFNWLAYLTLMNSSLLTLGVLRILAIRRT